MTLAGHLQQVHSFQCSGAVTRSAGLICRQLIAVYGMLIALPAVALTVRFGTSAIERLQCAEQAVRGRRPPVAAKL